METKIKSQKLGIYELLSIGWQLYRSNFKNIFIVALCFAMPLTIISSFGVPFISFVQQYGKWAAVIYTYIFSEMVLLINLIPYVGIIAIIDKAIQGQNLSGLNAIKYACRKSSKFLVTAILASLICHGLLLLLVIPSVIYFVYYSFFICVVALRDKSGMEALNYSKSLAKGQWMRVANTGFVVMITVCLIALPVSVLLHPLLTSSNELFILIANIVTYVFGGMFLPFFIVVWTVFFLNNEYVYLPQTLARNT